MPKFNPFRPNDLVRPGMFAGRGSELTAIEQKLFQTMHGNSENFLIEGERGIGKSSLLLFVDWLARGQLKRLDGGSFNFFVVHVELQSAHSYEDIVRVIAADLKREMADKDAITAAAKKAWEFLSNWEVLGVSYNKETSSIQPYQLLESLTDVVIRIANDARGLIDGVLILIDEADKPAVEADLGTFVKLLTERLAKRGCDNVLLGLAGLPELIPKLRESHESSPRVFTTIRLEPLEPEERVYVITRGLEVAKERAGTEVEITSEAAEAVSNLSEGYPHFVQQFAHSAFDEDRNGRIDLDDVLSGAYKEGGALDQLGSKFFQVPYYEKIGSDDYRKVLHVMADYLDDFVARSYIKESAGIKEITLNNALKALRERGIIISNKNKAGEYRLPTKSFAVWIKAVEARANSGVEGEEPPLPFNE